MVLFACFSLFCGAKMVLMHDCAMFGKTLLQNWLFSIVQNLYRCMDCQKEIISTWELECNCVWECECDCEQGTLCEEFLIRGNRVVERLPRCIVVLKISYMSIKYLSSLSLCKILIFCILFYQLIMSHLKLSFHK